MNEYLKTLREVDRSTQQLLAGEYHSLESKTIKDSATELDRSLQPCIEEIQSSALRLKGLIEACLKDLADAEEVWSSKKRIVDLPESCVWEGLGHFTGYKLKIQQLSDSYQKEIVEEAQAHWNREFESLKNQVFMDEKNQIRKGIGWSDKEKFLKKMPSLLEDYARKVDRLIKDGLIRFLNHLTPISLTEIKALIALLDSPFATQLFANLDQACHEVETSFNYSVNKLTTDKTYLLTIEFVFRPYIEDWKKRFGDITWDEVSGFSSAVLFTIEKRVKTIMEDRVSVAQKSLEKAIAFHVFFLETHSRYTAETPEQKLAEKAWIDQQRQKLQHLQTQLGLLHSD